MSYPILKIKQRETFRGSRLLVDNLSDLLDDPLKVLICGVYNSTRNARSSPTTLQLN